MSWTYRPQLDGLRAVAVYLVLLFHAGLPWAGGGFIGVDLFFVLSGFLVTGVILAEIRETGSLRLGTFYSRRVRRLLPAALVVVVATSLLFVLVAPVARRVAMVRDGQSALLYVANWHFLWQSGDYFAAGIDKSPFLHFWSLAVEEQYYVAFPLLLLLLSRTSRRLMAAALVALMALSLAAQLHWAGVDATHAYYGTDARLYQLLAGAVCAVAMQGPSRQRERLLAAVTTPLGLAGLLVLGSGLLDVSASTRGIGATVASVLVVHGLHQHEATPVARWLARPVPVFLGRISYGTYLWHWPVIVALGAVLDVGPVVVAVLAAAVATGLAAASYEVLEMPIRRSARLGRARWYPAAAGVAVSALVAVTVVPWTLQTDRRPSLVAVAAPGPAVAVASSSRVPPDIDWAAVKDDVGKEGTCTARAVADCTVVRGDGPHVLLVGDSQAETLVPMFERLAREHDLTLSLNVLAGCPWQEGLENLKASAGTRHECDEARVGWYDDVLPLLHPDVVIVLDRPRDDPDEWQGVLRRRDGRRQPLQEAVYQTSNETLRKITAVAPRTLLVQRLVMPETFDPLDCLSSVRRAGRCAVPVPLGVTPSDGYNAAAAARSPKVETVDLNPAFCPTAPVCHAVADGKVVYRDDHHFTARYGLSRRDQVWRILRGTEAF